MITDEMVEAAAAAQWHYDWPRREFHREPDDLQDFYRNSARAALEVAAPLIAAKALMDARKALRSLADQWEQRADFNAGQGGEFWQGMAVKGRECAFEARARADHIERGES